MRKTGGSGSQFGRPRSGFTLVELLVVIAIIGVLAGLLVPGVLAVRNSFTRSAIKFEVQALADAVEKYRSKHGDYPPDGSSWPIMEAHLRKAFPNILISELNLLNPAMSAGNGYIRNDNGGRVMDPAEALVFFLGGFSSDSQRPLTGPGGPFVATGSGSFVYNVQRQNAMYEFPSARLTLGADAISTDDDSSSFGTGPINDLLPVFLCYHNKFDTGNPYVYFDSRSYQGGVPASPIFNYHRTTRRDTQNNPYVDVIRPMLAETGLFENIKTFQLGSPGMDGQYGGSTANNPVLFSVKGTPMEWNPAARKFVPSSSSFGPFKLNAGSGTAPMYDNCVDVVEAKTLGENL